jgi:hypothetical protein
LESKRCARERKLDGSGEPGQHRIGGIYHFLRKLFFASIISGPVSFIELPPTFQVGMGA